MGTLYRVIGIVGKCVLITCRNKRLSSLKHPSRLWSPFLLFTWYLEQISQDMKLTIHLHLVARLRICRTYLYFIFIIFHWFSGNSCRLLLPCTWKHWLLFGKVNGVTFFNTSVFYKAEEVWFMCHHIHVSLNSQAKIWS
jgi:hypothetical protein